MGEHEGWAEPCGLLPNGLLPNTGMVIRVLDSERWSKAEERIAELIACIQPNQPSEERRNAVADYVQRLIMKCFPCQVFTFGSVPLKTYLPDGDIDVTAFSNNQNLKDTWANQVRDMLENEEKNDQAEFRVKEVQYIQAEVKIIKCLVENIVVDISFNQLGGLCTLCFLEEVDHLINHNHLFKRSIILIKAWCYYESRILGAHHGLISTYALETLVLYIFHVFNKSFTGPLEVLYRFLEFFSNFDWENFCVSLWGPVPISSLPDVTAEPPRKDGGNLLLSKLFLDACSTVYAVFPAGQENQGQSFVSKHFNVIDPLRVNNNLGRSVSKGNFFRIRSAFAFGAKRLSRLLECPKENLIYEVNQFFTNTWERHGSGQRPDAPGTDIWASRSSSTVQLSESDNLKSNRVRKSSNGGFGQIDAEGSPSVASRQSHYSSGSMSNKSDPSTTSHSPSRMTRVNHLNSSRLSDHTARGTSANHIEHVDESQRNKKSDQLLNDIHGRFMFARTRSSPELTETYGDVSPQVRRHRTPEGSKTQPTPAKLDGNNRKNQGSERLANYGGRSSTDDSSSIRGVPSHQGLDAAGDSVSGSNSYHRDSVSEALNELSSTTETQGFRQEEQDLVNMMASTSLHFNGQVQLPINLPSAHLPFTIPPSFLASLGYTQRNMPGLVPANVPLIDPSISNLQFPPGLVPQPLVHRFPGVGLNSNLEYSSEHSNENLGSMEMNSAEAENEFWQDQEAGSSGGFETENGNLEMLPPDERGPSNLSSFNIIPPSWVSGAGTSMRVQQIHGREKWAGSRRGEHLDNNQFHDNSAAEAYYDERMSSSRFSSASHGISVRSRTPESYWDGSSAKVSKSTRERRGEKIAATELAGSYGKGKTMPENTSDHIEDDDHEWNPQSNIGAEILERNPVSQSVASMLATRNQVPGNEVAQIGGSDPAMPVTPMIMGSGSWQRENPGLVAFYPTGPPVPFLTMLPVYDASPETGASDGHFGREESKDNDMFQNFDSTGGLDHSEDVNSSTSFRLDTSVGTSEEHKSDILNSDFASHFQNLQFGRFCQNPPTPGPLFYQTPVMVPPGYLQGRFPWDGPAKPLPTNINLLTQLMGYGNRVVPVAPLQSVPARPPNVYQRFADDMPRYRSGTGTYLPNPKVSVRDRQTSNTRRGNYHYDRNDSHADREGNWNGNPKSRGAGRAHNRNQTDKSISRLDRLSSSESRADRSWGQYRNESFSSFPSRNGPMHSNASVSGPLSVAYGLYPLPSVNSAGVSSNGPSVPPLVMMYPFEHNANFGSHGEQLEFGSIGPIGVTGTGDSSHPSDGRARVALDEHRFHEAPGQRSSPDQPSSPHHRRKM